MENINPQNKILRSHIYQFYNLKEEKQKRKRYALVVSDNSRCTDSIISIIVLSNKYRDNLIKINGNFGTKYVDGELVTYCSREQLGRQCGEVTDSTMKVIDKSIAKGLGLFNTEEQEKEFYKIAYEGIINKMINNDDMISQ